MDYDGPTCFLCGSVETHARCTDCDFLFCEECLTNGKCADCRKSWSERTPGEQAIIAAMCGNVAALEKLKTVGAV